MKKRGVKPETEIMLAALQESYLENRGIESYQRLFSALLPYSRSLILKKTVGKIFLPADLVDSTALEATIKFMSQYEKKEFRVDSSFAGLLSFKVLEAMYGPKIVAADQIISLNDHIERGSKVTELGDMAESLNFTYLFRPDSNSIGEDPGDYLFRTENDIINSILTVFTDLYMGSDLHTFLVISIALDQFISKKKTYDRYVEKFLNEKQKDILELAILEIKNRLLGVA